MTDIFRRFSSFQISLLAHIIFVSLFFLMSFDFFKINKIKKVDFEVYTEAITAQVSTPVVNKPVEEIKKKEVTARQVFGVTRKSIKTSDSSGIEIKAGNTTAKKNDDLILDKNDSESLPIPVADYLITEEPSVISEPKNKQRTEEARKNGYTGTIRMKILVDTEGVVRDVKLLNSLKYGLDQRAIEIVKQVKLSPAKVNGKPVTVLRDFTITFKATD